MTTQAPHTEEEEEARAVRESTAYAIAWVWVYLFTPKDSSLVVVFRRFIAFTYVLRPDLLEGRTIRSLSSELGTSKTQFSQIVKQIRKDLRIGGVLARSAVRGRRRRVVSKTDRSISRLIRQQIQEDRRK